MVRTKNLERLISGFLDLKILLCEVFDHYLKMISIVEKYEKQLGGLIDVSSNIGSEINRQRLINQLYALRISFLLEAVKSSNTKILKESDILREFSEKLEMVANRVAAKEAALFPYGE